MTEHDTGALPADVVTILIASRARQGHDTSHAKGRSEPTTCWRCSYEHLLKKYVPGWRSDDAR